MMRRLLSIALLLRVTDFVFASSRWYASFFEINIAPTIKGRVIDQKYVYEGPNDGQYLHTILVLDNFGLNVPDTITLVWSSWGDGYSSDVFSKQYIDQSLEIHRKLYLKDPENYHFLLDNNTDYYFVFKKIKADQSYWMERHFEIKGDSTYCREGYFTKRLEKKKQKRMPVKSFEKKLRAAYRYRIDDFNKRISVRQREYVDLGLSVKWATCNVGADEPDDGGLIYAWGEHLNKIDFEWSNYWLCIDSCDNLTKYNTKPGFGPVDSLTVLEPDEDVAHVRWGGNWRMPSIEEWQELKDNCTWTLDSIKPKYYYMSGTKVYRITSNIPGYTDRSIILPATNYWSRDLDADDPSRAFSLNASTYRYKGLLVRPVCP